MTPPLQPNIKNKFKNSHIYAAQVGYELPLPVLDVRLGGKYLHFSPDVKGDKSRYFDGLMANAFADIPAEQILVSPFLARDFNFWGITPLIMDAFS